MCGIWVCESCQPSDSCNVFGHDFVAGDCVYCGQQEHVNADAVSAQRGGL